MTSLVMLSCAASIHLVIPGVQDMTLASWEFLVSVLLPKLSMTARYMAFWQTSSLLMQLTRVKTCSGAELARGIPGVDT